MPELPADCYLVSGLTVKGVKQTTRDKNHLPRKIWNVRLSVKFFLAKVAYVLVG
jgi:hypothetical protein